MSDVHSLAQAITHLSDLENLAGATLATNVGYLSLQRFRYREQIRTCATDQLAPIGREASLPDSIKNSDQYKDIVYLAKLADNDGLDESKRRASVKGHSLSGAWAAFYKYLFSIHQDLFVAAALAGLAIFLLLVGVATTIGIWSTFDSFGYGWKLQASFWLLTVGFFLPGAFVWIGRWVVREGCKHATDAGKQAAALLKDIAQSATAPENGH